MPSEALSLLQALHSGENVTESRSATEGAGSLGVNGQKVVSALEDGMKSRSQEEAGRERGHEETGGEVLMEREKGRGSKGESKGERKNEANAETEREAPAGIGTTDLTNLSLMDTRCSETRAAVNAILILQKKCLMPRQKLQLLPKKGVQSQKIRANLQKKPRQINPRSH